MQINEGHAANNEALGVVPGRRAIAHTSPLPSASL